MNLEFSRQILEKYSNIKVHKNPSIEGRVVPCGLAGWRADMMKLIAAFRNFARASKNTTNLLLEVTEREQRCACYNAHSHDCSALPVSSDTTHTAANVRLNEWRYLRQAQKIYVNMWLLKVVFRNADLTENTQIYYDI